MNRYLSKFLTSTFLWALIPTVIVSFFVRDIGTPYILSQQSGLIQKEDQIFFHDLNGDGTTEQIHSKPGEPLNNLPIMTNDGKYYDQWNVGETFVPEISELIFGDYDHDGLSEIYVFSMNRDTIFLNALEAFDSSGLRLRRHYVTVVNLVEGQNNSVIKPVGFFDYDKDGFKEFYFAITTGFGLWPRNCYLFNLKTLKLFTSASFGVNFDKPTFADLDNDSVPEIITSSSSPGNQKSKQPLSDRSAWLMVLGPDLEFIFPPREFSGFGGRIDVEPLKAEGGSNLLVIYNYSGSKTPEVPPGFHIFSREGKRVAEKSFASIGLQKAMPVIVTDKERKEFAMLSNPVSVFNSNLEIIRSISLPFSSDFTFWLVDLTGDGSNEIFLYSAAEGRLVLCTSNFAVMSVLDIDFPEGAWTVSVVREQGELNRIHIRSGEKQWNITLEGNPAYFFRHAIYAGIYLGFFVLILITRRISTAQVKKQEALKKKLLTLQLQSIKSQLDPHFTFNALNSISSLLYMDDRKTAYDALNIFTRLLRQLLNDADKVFRPLREELEFVTRYLELEKIRFSHFKYAIDMADNVSGDELIPKMAVQLFAENSIKHGLVPKGKDGFLSIRVHRTINTLVLTIEDNGIGRKQSALESTAHGKGIKINNDFYETLSQLTGKTVQTKFTDLYGDEGNAAGTRVEVFIPINAQHNVN